MICSVNARYCYTSIYLFLLVIRTALPKDILHILLTLHNALNDGQHLSKVLESNMFDPFPLAICGQIVLIAFDLDEEDIGVFRCGHVCDIICCHQC